MQLTAYKPLSALAPMFLLQGGHKVGEKILIFPDFSSAINLLFHRLSQQKVNAIMTIKGHSTSTPAIYRPSILADIYWAGSLLPEILMILFTQSTAVSHKYLNDELKILCLLQRC